MTLNDFANARDDVVLFWTSVGVPTGDYAPLGHSALDFADRRGLLDLEGEIDAAGDWQWSGLGNPTDDRANTILRLRAYPDQAKWAAIVAEVFGPEYDRSQAP